MNRMGTMIKRCDKNRILSHKIIVGSKETKKGIQNTWDEIQWQKPYFPFIENKPTFKDQIEIYWKDKPVRFAEFNNCVGCFHREPALLKYMWEKQADKMQVFSDFEKNRKYKNDTFKMNDNITYEKIKNLNLNVKLTASNFTDCDSGYCGL